MDEFVFVGVGGGVASRLGGLVMLRARKAGCSALSGIMIDYTYVLGAKQGSTDHFTEYYV